MKILVVAPRFPSLNQPWIDTYLEQLLKHHIEFRIYSSLDSPEAYNSKVDTLDLKKYLLHERINTAQNIRLIITSLLTSPRVTLRIIIDSIRLTKNISHRLKERLISALIFFYFRRFNKTYKDISLVHSHSEIGAYLFMHLCILEKIPLVLTFHGLTPAGVTQLAQHKRKILYDNVSLVLINTNFAAKQVTHLGAKKETLKILPQGLPMNDFRFSPTTRPEDGKPVRIMTVGRFHRDKGQHYAILALRRLKNEGYKIEWNFVGVGTGVENLKALAVKLDVQNEARFHVALSDIAMKNLYESCHIYVLSSIERAVHIETQGVVLQEAQASGCLVIATRAGGVPECVNHDKDALLIRPGSSRAIYEAVRFYIENPDQWHAFLHSGLQNVKNNFSADVIGEKMSSILYKTARKAGKI